MKKNILIMSLLIASPLLITNYCKADWGAITAQASNVVANQQAAIAAQANKAQAEMAATPQGKLQQAVSDGNVAAVKAALAAGATPTEAMFRGIVTLGGHPDIETLLLNAANKGNPVNCTTGEYSSKAQRLNELDVTRPICEAIRNYDIVGIRWIGNTLRENTRCGWREDRKVNPSTRRRMIYTRTAVSILSIHTSGILKKRAQYVTCSHVAGSQ